MQIGGLVELEPTVAIGDELDFSHQKSSLRISEHLSCGALSSRFELVFGIYHSSSQVEEARNCLKTFMEFILKWPRRFSKQIC